ncbi:MAG: type II secretion system F family protein [Dehalococcoidia bacterium]|nr:type II secretion system F family protein [Dehalococcoidia bacterium]
MHVTYSLLLGIGLLLIFLALTSKRTEHAPRGDASAADAGWVAALPDAGGRLAPAAAVGVVTAVLTQAFLGWPALSLAAGTVGAFVPSWVARQREERRREAVEDAVVEAAAVLRDGSRVGIGLEDGLRSLARTGPLALRPSFRALARDLRLAGFEEAVTRAREQVAHPSFDMLCAALLMSYRVGGRNLSDVLDGLARSVRGTARARREVRAQQAEQVLSARVIAALPLVLIVAIRATNPGYLEVFSTPGGQLALAVCLVSVAVGYAGMLRATVLPGRERVLR